MDAGTPLRRGLSLTQRLALSLVAGAFFVALVLGFLSATRENEKRIVEQARTESEFLSALAERAAPLLERGDLMRLSVLATVGRDQIRGRVIVLDGKGRVAIDTALVLGDRQLGLLAGSGPFQRTIEIAGESPEEAHAIRETLVPVRFGGEVIGEVRLRRELTAAGVVFDFAWFGLILISCLTLVVVAVGMAHHWSVRIRRATDSVIRMSAGETGGVEEGVAVAELAELDSALRAMEKGMHEGLSLVSSSFAGMAQQLVDNLERARLVPPGHGERTAQLAERLADRLQLVQQDRADLVLACRLVDLGKAWVRPAILQKRGELTEAEAVSLRQHPLRAAEALEAMPAMRPVARILRHQAERYDGCGVPDQLRGDRIPLGSRVLAIAAAFDLLTTCAGERPMAWCEALARLSRARGEVFDPWLLDLFAEEIEADPPEVSNDRPVMIVPTGSVPWRETCSFEDDEDYDESFPDELEVLADEDGFEEGV